MSKMKHLLRKLHIGGGINDHHHHHHRLPDTRPAANQRPSPSQSASSNGTIAAVESGGGDQTTTAAGVGSGCSGGVDFNLLEEEFQVQLALAISVSDPDARKDPESAQIDAAKRISLGCSVAAPVTETSGLVDSLSLRYWSYNVVNYNEKVMDGFYDVYGITSNSVVEGKMPFLVDLQAISISDNVEHEVILVNRLTDPELQDLEKKVYLMSLESQAYDDLIQKIADIVVDRMGGPVGDAEGITRRWSKRSCELRTTLNTVILPLGRLDVGLSRHRALLFKVLADRINLPCMLVKGSYYTGTDDGAVNLIKIDDESEYIIDLMGAPGVLIPAEVPSSYLSSAVFDLRGFTSLTDTTGSSSLSLTEGPGTRAVSPNLDRVPHVGSSMSEETSILGIETSKSDMNLVEKEQTERFEHEFGKLFQSSHGSLRSSLGLGQPSCAKNINVKNVSEYVISAAKNPEFAQKLHAVLLESGASPPPDLFSNINSQGLEKQNMHEQLHWANAVNADNSLQYCSDKFLPRHEQSLLPFTGENFSNDSRCNYEQEQSAKRLAELRRGLGKDVLKSEVISDQTCDGFVLVDNRSAENLQLNAVAIDALLVNPLQMLGRSMAENQIYEPSLPFAIDSCQFQPENTLHSDDQHCFQMKTENMEMAKEPDMKLIEKTIDSLGIDCNGYSKSINPVLGEVAEWEIPWEDLQIGERIGIGSYGEVYRADWNGTEVAVKKFLDQDLSGDALVQFKCEAEMMIRLRHPNVVLFMGAVTRPPHLSILTEFLPRGSLYRLLHRSGQLDEKRRMRMALDVAKGMNYLHQSHPTIVHRDLKSPNLLVDKNWVVKVCDFGLSRMKHHTFLSSKSTAGTPEWMAPEVLRNEPANEKCDVYSFGVILWELVTCQIPWKGLNPMQVVGAVGFQNRRLEIPEDVDSAVACVIRDCWQMEPHFRPSFAQLISRLRHVQQLRVERTNHMNQTD